jgi:hypothetical protein
MTVSARPPCGVHREGRFPGRRPQVGRHARGSGSRDPVQLPATDGRLLPVGFQRTHCDQQQHQLLARDESLNHVLALGGPVRKRVPDADERSTQLRPSGIRRFLCLDGHAGRRAGSTGTMSPSPPRLASDDSARQNSVRERRERCQEPQRHNVFAVPDTFFTLRPGVRALPRRGRGVQRTPLSGKSPTRAKALVLVGPKWAKWAPLPQVAS